MSVYFLVCRLTPAGHKFDILDESISSPWILPVQLAEAIDPLLGKGGGLPRGEPGERTPGGAAADVLRGFVVHVREWGAIGLKRSGGPRTRGVAIRGMRWYAVRVSEELDAENVSDVLGREHVLRILALASGRPMSVEELSERCDVSLTTVYRGVNTLERYGLLSKRMAVDGESGRYTTYETSVDRLCLHIGDGDLAVSVRGGRDIVDRFTDFWDDLGTEGDDERGDD